MRSGNGMTILPPGMDGKVQLRVTTGPSSTASSKVPTNDTTNTWHQSPPHAYSDNTPFLPLSPASPSTDIVQSLPSLQPQPPQQSQYHTQQQQQPPPPRPSRLERASFTNIRASFKASNAAAAATGSTSAGHNTIRSITSDPFQLPPIQSSQSTQSTQSTQPAPFQDPSQVFWGGGQNDLNDRNDLNDIAAIIAAGAAAASRKSTSTASTGTSVSASSSVNFIPPAPSQKKSSHSSSSSSKKKTHSAISGGGGGGGVFGAVRRQAFFTSSTPKDLPPPLASGSGGPGLVPSVATSGPDHPSSSSSVNERKESKTPPSPQLSSKSHTYYCRPRNRTMDGGTTTTIKRRQVATTGSTSPSASADSRPHRVGSVSSSGSQCHPEEPRFSPQHVSQADYFIGPSPRSAPEPPPPTVKEKKHSSTRRLIRRTSRPASPVVSFPPSVDSLPLPIPADDANKVLQLMRNLCGRMRGEVEYQEERSNNGPQWLTGVAYIDEDMNSLMLDPAQTGSSHITLIPDLRGCRVLPVERPGSVSVSVSGSDSNSDSNSGSDRHWHCLELVAPQPQPIDVLLRPVVASETDLWLAALLCWQQLRPAGVRITNGKPAALMPVRPELIRRHGSTNDSTTTKQSNIIKMGTVLLWDKGPAHGPRNLVRRSSTRDVHTRLTTSWRRVSCTLHDNGEFRLLLEGDGIILSTIELSQLSRCAIQHLDRTVLDEEHCIGIFPIYHPTSTQLSIFRPVYIALDSRVSFEVWFVLLRAFALPDMFHVGLGQDDRLVEIRQLDAQFEEGEVFRVERSISVRITEAKISQRQQQPPTEAHPIPDKAGGVRAAEKVHKDHKDKEKTKDRDRDRDRDRDKDKDRDKDNRDCKDSRDKHRDHYGDLDAPVNYLAEVLLDGEIRARTMTKSGNNPFWREDSEFLDLPPMTPLLLSVLLKRVEGTASESPSIFPLQISSGGPPKITGTRETHFGCVDIPLNDRLGSVDDHEQWLHIYNHQTTSVGTMLVKVHHDQLAVLLDKEYRALSELLHRFPASLSSQIASALPTQLRRLAEIFLNIFQVTRSASEWIMTLVEDEIDGIGTPLMTQKRYRFSSRLKSAESLDSAMEREQIVRDMGRSLAGEANLLFRGNSLLTQSLEFHMRRLGKEFLEDALRDKIRDINEMNPDCEVDPGRMQPYADELSQHWTLLIGLTNEIWRCIVNAADNIPPELRQILKYVRAVAEDRYGNFLRTVAYTSVSGFLFLRFVCPAILSPKLFGLLRDHPKHRAQRTLTIIAKALQKLANLSTFGKREEWMEPMNKFLNSNRQIFRDYIDRVCSIPTESSTTVSVPAVYSTPITILGRLSTLRREGFPSLPYLIDHSRNFAALVKLWTDANPVAGAIAVGSPDVDNDLSLFNDMCFKLQRKSDACLAKMEAARAASEPSSSSSYACGSIDDLAMSVGRSSFGESLVGTRRFVPPAALAWNEAGYDYADEAIRPGSSGSDAPEASQEGLRRSREGRWRGRAPSNVVRQFHGGGEGEKSGRSGKGSTGAKTTRMILSGIMKIGRDSPDMDAKEAKESKGKR